MHKRLAARILSLHKEGVTREQCMKMVIIACLKDRLKIQPLSIQEHQNLDRAMESIDNFQHDYWRDWFGNAS